MRYPIEKYKFIRHTRPDGREEVIALSTFAGRTVRGKAILDDKDAFNLETGKRLAALRCAEKIGVKRVLRANDCLDCADAHVEAAKRFQEKMTHYYEDATLELAAVRDELDKFTRKLMD